MGFRDRSCVRTLMRWDLYLLSPLPSIRLFCALLTSVSLVGVFSTEGNILSSQRLFSLSSLPFWKVPHLWFPRRNVKWRNRFGPEDMVFSPVLGHCGFLNPGIARGGGRVCLPHCCQSQVSPVSCLSGSLAFLLFFKNCSLLLRGQVMHLLANVVILLEATWNGCGCTFFCRRTPRIGRGLSADRSRALGSKCEDPSFSPFPGWVISKERHCSVS